ncbi:MAG: HEAT repeat domain-containing protein [Methanomicrobiales archaeon]|nr:HEAT repeat domain-containing protein [Methanomicrobiales archaeon]
MQGRTSHCGNDFCTELGDERVVLPLIRTLDDPSAYVRKAAAEALGRINAIKAVKPLMKSLTDNDRYLREGAPEALGHLGDIAIPDILSCLEDKDWMIRLGSVVALRVSSGIVPSLDLVIRTLSDDSPYVRREAVKTLGRIGDHTVVPYLVQATKDPDSGGRLRAVRALVKLGER